MHTAESIARRFARYLRANQRKLKSFHGHPDRPALRKAWRARVAPVWARLDALCTQVGNACRIP